MATFADRRLRAQRIVRPEHETVRDVVTWMLAIQAQDYAGAKWAVALRVKGGAVGEADVERAVADGTIVRTHVMRGTWQFVTPADARWLLALLGPRVIASSARRYRWLGLDAAAFRKSRTLMTRALRDGNAHTRDELRDVLRAG